MRRTWLVGLVVLAAACGGSATAPPSGPLQLGIVSGNNQSAIAGRERLTAAVVGKLVQKSDGSVAWVRINKAGSNVLDLLVPTAQAQSGTIVTGNPIPGAVVCATPLANGSMTPFVACTNTDALGQATFFFDPGHVSGTVKAEIRGTYQSHPAVFDTATATVLPDSALNITVVRNSNGAGDGGDLGTFKAGAVLDLTTVIQKVTDKWGNQITGWTASTVQTPLGMGEIKVAIPPDHTGNQVTLVAGTQVLFVYIGTVFVTFALQVT